MKPPTHRPIVSNPWCRPQASHGLPCTSHPAGLPSKLPLPRTDWLSSEGVGKVIPLASEQNTCHGVPPCPLSPFTVRLLVRHYRGHHLNLLALWRDHVCDFVVGGEDDLAWALRNRLCSLTNPEVQILCDETDCITVYRPDGLLEANGRFHDFILFSSYPISQPIHNEPPAFDIASKTLDKKGCTLVGSFTNSSYQLTKLCHTDLATLPPRHMLPRKTGFVSKGL